MLETIQPPDITSRAIARATLDVEAARADPWYLIEKGWVITLDEKPPAGVPAIRPLPAKPYLKALVRLWQASPRGLLGKSRQMLASWLFAYLMLWDAIVNDGRHAVVQGKRLEDVDAENPHRILGRIRFIRDHLPPFFQPEVVTQNQRSETYANGSSIEAIPEGADIVRGKVPSVMFMDEVCFQETGEDNWNAANPSAAKLWGVSTPNGHEFLYRQGEAGRPWDGWNEWPELVTGVRSYQNHNGIQLVALHYTADEANRTPEAQARRREGYTDTRKYRREQELDFTLAEGLAVYGNEFDLNMHVIKGYEVDPSLPVYRGWDSSYNGQAVVFAQFNNSGQLVIFDCIIYKAVPLHRVAQEASFKLLRAIGRSPIILTPGMEEQGHVGGVIDYGDPASQQHNTEGETVISILSKYGVRLITKPSTRRKVDIVEGVRALLLRRNDGQPGLLVAKNSLEMQHMIAGFAGGYHYDKAREGKAEKEVPAKDGWFDHLFDALQYLVDNVSPIRPGSYNYDGLRFDSWHQQYIEPGIGTEGFLA